MNTKKQLLPTTVRLSVQRQKIEIHTIYTWPEAGIKHKHNCWTCSTTQTPAQLTLFQ